MRQTGSGQYESNDPIKVSTTNALDQTTQRSFTSRFAGISERSLTLASFIAHELGHILYAINNPLSDFAWSLLEEEYNLSDDRTDPQSVSFPSYTGGGHLEGNPTGNLAARLEFKFGKNCIENGLWKEADELIEKYGAQLKHNMDKFRFKENHIPSVFETYPETNPISQIYEMNFRISAYLRGNLSLDLNEFPTPIEIL